VNDFDQPENFMPAPESIQQLVKRFEEHHDSYLSVKYNETQLRSEFLDPFFEALGWDIFNKQSFAEAYKDVLREDSQKVEGSTRSPDYTFRVGGMRKFFVEAKKPAVSIQYDIHPAFQLRRYAWSAKLPLGILTDFEEFAVYESRSKPDHTDSAATGRVNLYRYTDYLTKWDEIAAVFSRESVMKGAFDQYTEGIKGKKGTLEVDDAFLAEIESWRDLLARTLALRNPDLQVRELNYAVQMTIDRIVFLRICEDREIEPEYQLKELLTGDKVYERLCALFQQADRRYNSGLFHFNVEKGQSSNPDALTLGLAIDDKSLKEIIRDLYYPSPYVFKEIPTDILGQVYERFLGKVIRLTAGHQAKVEEKPEVRKAGGVYYTPTYIVDYIVKNTIGKLLEGKTPKEAAQLKIVDPACGSGSFLLGAYQYLLDWHLQWYEQHGPSALSKGKNPVIYQAEHGEWHLTTVEKKRILLDNIHGVDIDPQAVEVTKLSLSLKVLEGESKESIGAQMSLFKERALPDLGKNIQCGNSLIGPDYYTDRQMTLGLEDEEERQRVNAFDWKVAFPEIFRAGGFDVVMGNPPYIRIQVLQEWAPQEVEFYKKRYESASKGNYDIYVVFVEKGLNLLNTNGRLGYILPNKFINSQYGELLRTIISQGKYLSKLIHFGDQQIFEKVTTYTCLLFLDKSKCNEFEFERVNNINEWHRWNISSGDDNIFFRLSKMPKKLSTISDRIFQGLVTGVDAVFILKKIAGGKYYSNSTKKEYILEKELMHPLCKGSVNIRRYHITDLDKFILFPYKIFDGKAKLFPENELMVKFPEVWRYLLENRSKLEAREHGKWKHDKWYAFGRSQNLTEMEQKKILTPCIAKCASFTLDLSENLYFVGSGGGGGGGYGITLNLGEKIAYEYVLGLLNSKLLDSYLKSFSSPFSGGYFAYNRQYIEQIPIYPIDLSKPEEKSRHDRIVVLVNQIIGLNKQTARTPQEQEGLKREIAATDAEIDRLVYELYGLTKEDIKVVEGRS
jgi:hypothetical protein